MWFRYLCSKEDSFIPTLPPLNQNFICTQEFAVLRILFLSVVLKMVWLSIYMIYMKYNPVSHW